MLPEVLVPQPNLLTEGSEQFSSVQRMFVSNQVLRLPPGIHANKVFTGIKFEEEGRSNARRHTCNLYRGRGRETVINALCKRRIAPSAPIPIVRCIRDQLSILGTGNRGLLKKKADCEVRFQVHPY